MDNTKKAIRESVFYVLISIVFGMIVYAVAGATAGNEWFTAYIVEKSLSVDNLFVMYLIFQYFKTPEDLQHRCLFWGIVGAVVLRGICIVGGVTLLHMFHWLIYPLGMLLVYSGVKIYFTGEEDEGTIKENRVVKFFRAHFPVTDNYVGNKFFIVDKRTHKGKCEDSNRPTKYYATVLFIVLLMIETTDIIFAMDSIPAALGVSQNAFVLYTSNIMAVLGLRALYFVLASMVDKLWALKYGISIVLSFIGTKMLISGFYTIPTNLSLLVTLIVLSASVAVSLIKEK